MAGLRSFRDGTTWKGFIVFEGEHSTAVYRIALVCSGSDLVDARGHF